MSSWNCYDHKRLTRASELRKDNSYGRHHRFSSSYGWNCKSTACNWDCAGPKLRAQVLADIWLCDACQWLLPDLYNWRNMWHCYRSYRESKSFSSFYFFLLTSIFLWFNSTSQKHFNNFNRHKHSLSYNHFNYMVFMNEKSLCDGTW